MKDPKFYTHDIHQLLGMSNEEINALVAIYQCGYEGSSSDVIDRIHKAIKKGDFDYCGDWKWCGVLLDWFSTKSFGLTMTNNCLNLLHDGEIKIQMMSEANYKKSISIAYILIKQGGLK